MIFIDYFLKLRIKCILHFFFFLFLLTSVEDFSPNKTKLSIGLSCMAYTVLSHIIYFIEQQIWGGEKCFSVAFSITPANSKMVSTAVHRLICERMNSRPLWSIWTSHWEVSIWNASLGATLQYCKIWQNFCWIQSLRCLTFLQASELSDLAHLQMSQVILEQEKRRIRNSFTNSHVNSIVDWNRWDNVQFVQ